MSYWRFYSDSSIIPHIPHLTLTCGMWYVVYGMWYMVCGMWYVVCVVCGMWYVVWSWPVMSCNACSLLVCLFTGIVQIRVKVARRQYRYKKILTFCYIFSN